MSGFFRGTSVHQDSRFFNQDKKLLAKLSFPPCFDQRVDLTKVKREVVAQWITERVTQLLGFEDDIVVSMIINLLEPKVDERLDPRQMQLTITGFLEKDAAVFMKELWELLLSAQAHPTGIPPAILEKKKQEMAQAAQNKQQLRDVLERKRHEARGGSRYGPDADKPTYGLNRSKFSDREPRASREPTRREPRHPRSEARRSRSRSARRSRSPSRSRSRLRTRNRSRRNRRSRSRSNSRDPSRSRSPRREESRRRRSRTPPRRRRRSPSSSASSRSPSPDQFGRDRRRRSSSTSRKRSPSRSASR